MTEWTSNFIFDYYLRKFLERTYKATVPDRLVRMVRDEPETMAQFMLSQEYKDGRKAFRCNQNESR